MVLKFSAGALWLLPGSLTPAAAITHPERRRPVLKPLSWLLVHVSPVSVLSAAWCLEYSWSYGREARQRNDGVNFMQD